MTYNVSHAKSFYKHTTKQTALRIFDFDQAMYKAQGVRENDVYWEKGVGWGALPVALDLYTVNYFVLVTEGRWRFPLGSAIGYSRPTTHDPTVISLSETMWGHAPFVIRPSTSRAYRRPKYPPYCMHANTYQQMCLQ